MSHLLSRRPQRRVTGLAAAFALGVSTLGVAVVGGANAPAAADPVEDCKEAFPVADLEIGDDLNGLTVTKGTTPEPFTAEVAGVVVDGIYPGVPMIVVKVDPAGLDIDTTEVTGIWQGISGSPLYAADGRLVGAVSYGLAGTSSWMAGVTPFEDMTDYFGTAGGSGLVRLDARTRSKVAAASGTSAKQLSQGFRRLPMVNGVGGVPSFALDPSAAELKKHTWLSGGAQPIGNITGSAAAHLDPAADTIVAGGNLAVSMAYGDIALAGIGTATSVCDDQVVGFGHPMNFGGESTLGLHPATALYIQGDWPSYKMANLGPIVGTVFGDHLTAVTGEFGDAPETASIISKFTYGSRNRTGTSQVVERTPDALATTTFYENLANRTRVLDGSFGGSEVMTWTIRGVDEEGRNFALAWTDRYLARYSLAEEVGYNLGDLLYSFSQIPGVKITNVSTTGTATRDTTTFRLVRVDQKRGSSWVKLTDSKPAVVRAGGKLVVRAVLQAPGKTVTVPLELAIPKKTAGRMVPLVLGGGGGFNYYEVGNSVTEVRASLYDSVRTDAIWAMAGDLEDVPGDGEEEEDYRAAARQYRKGKVTRFTTEDVSNPVAGQVGGMEMFMVRITR